MARILLGVTGSVAAIRTPLIHEGLRGSGHTVRVVATDHAVQFFDPTWLPADPTDLADDPVLRDSDEWPSARRWERSDPVLHIELRRWADILVVAPLDANTLAKFAFGLADNCLTCLFRAWDFGRPVILAPAMNTLMWDSPVTRRQLRILLEDRGDGGPAGGWSLDDVEAVFARHAPSIRVVGPIAKRLACGDVGLGAMAEVDRILLAVHQSLQTPIVPT